MALKDTIAKAESIIDDLSLPREFLDRLGLSVANVSRRLRVDQITAQSGRIAGVDVSRVEMGTATIDQIEVRGLSANLQSGQAELRNVRIMVELQFELEWEVDLGFLGSWGDTNELDVITIPISIGDIQIPDLSSIEMDIPAVNIPGISAIMSPITNLNMGRTDIKAMQVNTTELPSAGFNLTGLGVGGMEVNDVSVPGTKTSSATVEEVSPQDEIVLPQASLRALEIPATTIDDISSPSFNADAVAETWSIGADLGILDVTLRVTPVVHMDVGSMVLADVELAAIADEINLRDISLPVKVQGIGVQGIDLDDIVINKIKL